MKVQNLNGQNANYSSNKNIGFKGQNMHPINIIERSMRTLESGTQNPRTLRSRLRELFELAEGGMSHFSKPASFNFMFSKEKGILTKKLKSGNPVKQFEVIARIFELRGSLNDPTVVTAYLEKKVVPFVRDTQNKKLAEQILELTTKPISDRSATSIEERIRLINELGSKANIKELESYTGKQLGISDTVKEECGSWMPRINANAQSAIAKLKIASNF